MPHLVGCLTYLFRLILVLYYAGIQNCSAQSEVCHIGSSKHQSDLGLLELSKKLIVFFFFFVGCCPCFLFVYLYFYCLLYCFVRISCLVNCVCEVNDCT